MRNRFIKLISFAAAAVIANGAVLAPAADIHDEMTAYAALSTGDIDGDGSVTITDASLALTAYAKKAAGLSIDEFSSEQLQAADVNNDGAVNLDDAAAILEYYAKLGAGLSPSWGTEDTNPSEYDDGVMRTSMTAMEYAKDMGVGLNLGNTFDGYWEDLSKTTTGAQTIGSNKPVNYETCWGAVETTEAAIAGMAEEGFNTVRIPVYWGNMMADDGRFEINDEYIGRIGEVVDWCRKYDMYAIVNIHHYDMFLVKNHDKETVLAAAETLWTQIAEYFIDYSDYLVFEGYNEALGTGKGGAELSDSEAYSYVNDMNQVFVDAVRATGGNNEERLLIASGYWTNIDKTTSSRFIIPEDTADDRMMVSVHYIDNVCYWTNNVGGSYWLNYSKNQCELLKKAFIDKGIPVFVGECTGSYSSDRFASDASIKDSSECLSTILSMAVDYDLVPVLWDVSNGFYSRTQCRIASDSDAAVIAEIAARIENE